ncbi:hypothetical protein CBR_g56705 [Chara braunii]|uniref:Uncharacterized protein n=1 Tax=Chara braunii TaxID=69332 RepID=A0A388MDU8_CHABU|nr:hypothetical protein CBR_g56705 [Chara braunii]|eukprot:GBG92675.1 hypothetical protein CBR_g56705 [Chara braunii]
MLAKFLYPACLQTRIEEFNVHASRWVISPGGGRNLSGGNPLRLHRLPTTICCERFECEHARWDPKDGELCLSRARREETLVEAPSDTDVLIVRRTCVEAFRPSGRVGSVVHSFLSSPAFLDGEMRVCTLLSVRFGRAVASGCGPKLSVIPSRVVVRVVWLTCDHWVWCGRVRFAANLLGGCGGLCWIVRYLAVGDGLRREVHLQFKQLDFAASQQLIARSTIVRRSFGRRSGVTCLRAARPSLLTSHPLPG